MPCDKPNPMIPIKVAMKAIFAFSDEEICKS
jgi:hypothetical protein